MRCVTNPAIWFLNFLQFDRDTSDWTCLNTLHEMCNKPSNLVSQLLAWNNGDFFTYTLVGVEIEGQFHVVFFDDDTSGLFDRFSTNATHDGDKRTRVCPK